MSEFNYSIPMKPSYQAGVGSVGTAAEQLDGVASRQAAKKVVVKNTHASQILYVGRSDAVTATAGGNQLDTDQEVELEVDNPSDIWVIGSAAATTYTWYAL